MRWLRKIALAAALLLPSAALAQTPVTVIGPVTPGHCPSWFSTTQLQDSGAGCGTRYAHTRSSRSGNAAIPSAA